MTISPNTPSLTKRLRELADALDSVDDWANLSVQDAIAISMAIIVAEKASEKFPDLFMFHLRYYNTEKEN